MEADKNRRLLIVDDEKDLLILLRKVLGKKCGCDVAIARSGKEALEKIASWHPDVIMTDIVMPDMDGLQLLSRVSELDRTISVVIMTGYGTIEMAVTALKNGAYDFLEKPFDNSKISLIILRAFERTQLLRENQQLHKELQKSDKTTEFIGQSVPLQRAIDLLTRLGQSDATVLIRGESGTGKEVAARTIHKMSNRGKKRMITVNCPALPEQILESELFGYAKGAFTGADHDKDGLFLEASGSTILLDEIADIPVSLQTKLLRVLQEKEIQPLGQTSTVKVDVRVLASTNQDLEAKMERGEFREDLFYRLNVMTVTMPSLEEIREDIPLLALHFFNIYVQEYHREGMEFSQEALKCLERREWKGNVRELQNRINRAVLLTPGDIITPKDLLSPEELEEDGLKDKRGVEVPVCVYQLPYNEAKEEVMVTFTSTYLERALTMSNGNVSAAARESGLGRQSFQRLMQRFKVSSQPFRG
ncbi:CheY-like receiver, AAA-type ATPase and DNA-binding domain-containing response regulator [Desulfocapsa sulfexigens DSM 10523]|uniref:CheY-like receiver, AAA-type ATPase and DNA-binding domain-containing response regulator n=1 Tax=Desulfocapsa sulfexigens (strain DSM 10523 / SB164P1) TaxID=1167006 RepID=M1PL47_DESSD|nr:sigma-54 dependent transcriptional regulator [Desulfocapsa sulfexigens]AGF77206.1 CheY-like receiver, AAA-type ATPase and DNA-binding domain-containing response regulator [Desulfocapsa sulfexigens DSM 10523]